MRAGWGSCPVDHTSSSMSQGPELSRIRTKNAPNGRGRTLLVNRQTEAPHDPQAGLQDFLGKGGESGGNRTLNPQIKSGFEEAKALEILMIWNAACADDGTGRHPGVTSTVAHARNCWEFDKGDSEQNDPALGNLRG